MGRPACRETARGSRIYLLSRRALSATRGLRVRWRAAKLRPRVAARRAAVPDDVGPETYDSASLYSLRNRRCCNFYRCCRCRSRHCASASDTVARCQAVAPGPAPRRANQGRLVYYCGRCSLTRLRALLLDAPRRRCSRCRCCRHRCCAPGTASAALWPATAVQLHSRSAMRQSGLAQPWQQPWQQPLQQPLQQPWQQPCGSSLGHLSRSRGRARSLHSALPARESRGGCVVRTSDHHSPAAHWQRAVAEVLGALPSANERVGLSSLLLLSSLPPHPPEDRRGRAARGVAGRQPLPA